MQKEHNKKKLTFIDRIVKAYPKFTKQQIQAKIIAHKTRNNKKQTKAPRKKT